MIKSFAFRDLTKELKIKTLFDDLMLEPDLRALMKFVETKYTQKIKGSSVKLSGDTIWVKFN